MSTGIIVSVVIPTYKRSISLLCALQSIITQQTNFGFEVLVMDNGCDLALQAEIGLVARQAAIPVRYIAVPEIGLHNARHAGVRAAQGEILVFVDDDIIADQGWIQAIVGTFNDPDVHLVGGRNLPSYEEPPPTWLEAFWTRNPNGTAWCGFLSLLDYGNKVCEIDPMYVWGVNFAIRKKTLGSLGGFHPDSVPWELRRYRGDGESAVTFEVKRLGLKSTYQPEALVYHIIPKNRLTVEYFEKRSYLQGVSDSFTQIRSKRQPDGVWRLILHRLRRVIRNRLREYYPDSSEEIGQRVRINYHSGYEYHQREVRRDPELLKWVLRNNYWDGKLPLFQDRCSTKCKFRKDRGANEYQ